MLELENITSSMHYNHSPQSFSASVKLVSPKKEFVGTALEEDSISAVQTAIIDAFSKKRKLPKLNIFYTVQQIKGGNKGKGHCVINLNVRTTKREKHRSKIGKDMIVTFAKTLVSVLNEIAP